MTSIFSFNFISDVFPKAVILPLQIIAPASEKSTLTHVIAEPPSFPDIKKSLSAPTTVITRPALSNPI